MKMWYPFGLSFTPRVLQQRATRNAARRIARRPEGWKNAQADPAFSRRIRAAGQADRRIGGQASRQGRGGLAPGPSGERRADGTSRSTSMQFGDKRPRRQRRAIVVRSLFRSLGQLDLFPRRVFVGNLTQEMADNVELRPSLVVGTGDEPRGPIGIGRGEHCRPWPANNRTSDRTTSRPWATVSKSCDHR